ncbi:MAG TPA: PqqD family protein [Candidatus Aminicenantes bacterium]|nr:PqqD family protein [Candidatus Aminicenantes bacterium]
MEQQLTRSTIVKRGRDIPFSQLDHELLAIDSQAGYCYSLNETASRVWGLLEEPSTIEAICCELRLQYAVDEATCLREVTELLRGMCEAKLVEIVEEAPC